jgi:hypothetical protein
MTLPMVRHGKGDAITQAVDTGACESDRAFFRQHPQRNFRLRPAWSAEIEDFARPGVIIRELPDGLCWWVIVHQLVQHKIRLRWPLAAPHAFYPDPPETIVRDVWRKRVPRDARDKSRALRRDALRTLKQYGEIS